MLTGTAAAMVAGTATSVAATAGADESTGRSADPLVALKRAACPLTDLGALDRMIGHAKVVGLGEAAHSAHEFFLLKRRVFEHLAETRGFTTFALEASFGTGLLLDDYVTRGVGDPAAIMAADFQGEYQFWNTEEYLGLIRWMRRRNAARPTRPPLRFAGNDLGFPGAAAFDRVTAYLTAHRPDLTARMAAHYDPLRPAPHTQAGAWMATQRAKEQPARDADAGHADAALTLLRKEGGPGEAGRSAGRAYALALQCATVIAQSFTAYAYPDAQFPERMRYRDKMMARNTAWWLEQHGGRILLASSNTHIGYISDVPAQFPVPAGHFLREQLGDDFVNAGLTFGRGDINALPDFNVEQPKTYQVDPAPAGHNEHMLDRVHHRDFVLDLRTAPAAARTWAAEARKTHSYGLYWTTEDPDVALGHTFDLILHLHEVTPGHLR
ncbi:erythromycin esterase family protein [Streptomyces sp. BH055]|uniref:erythromycin esterase family protein n=1 Tax=Streptomyces sp. BH055 TaxID=3401173 RepID=UPI003BB7CB3A